MSRAEFSVPEIHCDGCAAAIRSALARLDGVGEVDVDVAGRRVEVSFDETRLDAAAVRIGIESAGFDVA